MLCTCRKPPIKSDSKNVINNQWKAYSIHGFSPFLQSQVSINLLPHRRIIFQFKVIELQIQLSNTSENFRSCLPYCPKQSLTFIEFLARVLKTDCSFSQSGMQRHISLCCEHSKNSKENKISFLIITLDFQFTGLKERKARLERKWTQLKGN